MSKWLLKDTDGTVVASAETQSFTYDFTQSQGGGYVIEYEDENGCAATPLTAGTECLEYTCETMISDYDVDTVYVKSLHIHVAMVAMQGDTKVYDNSFIPNSSLINGIDISANYITDKIVDKLAYDTENHYFYLTEPVEHGITFYNGQQAEITVEFETSHNNWTFDYSNDFECNYDSAYLTITKHIYPYRLIFRLDFGLSKEIGGELSTEAENRMYIGVDREQLTHEYSLLAYEDESALILHDFKADSLDVFNDMISRQFRGFNIPNEETWKNGFTLDIYAKSKGVEWTNKDYQAWCSSDGVISSGRVTISSNNETCSVINIKLISCTTYSNFVSIEAYSVRSE